MHLNSDVKRKKLLKCIKKLSKIYNLEFTEGKKHTKIKCIHNGKITMVPRHKIIKQYTANDIIKQLENMGFTDKDLENCIK